MLQVNNLFKSYTSKSDTITHAVDDVSIKFPERGMVFIVGKSGSGKSTLLNLIGGIDMPDKGEIVIDGKSSKDFEPNDFDAYRNTYIGFVFQEYNLINEYSIKANISLALELQGQKVEDRQIDDILEKVDLVELKNRRPNELSGGQKQRVAIARALIKNPEVILLDEPTGNLDKNTGEQIFNLLRELAKDKLVIVISHDIEYAEKYGDRIITLSDGKVIEDKLNTSKDITKDSEEKIYIKDNKLYLPNRELNESEIEYVNENSNLEIVYQEKEADKTKVKKDTIPIVNNLEENTKKEYIAKKSCLPLKTIAKIGISNFKLKPIKMIITVILAMLAFLSLGFTTVIQQYDVPESGARIFNEKNIDYIEINKGEIRYNTLCRTMEAFNENEINYLKNNFSDMTFYPIYRTDCNLLLFYSNDDAPFYQQNTLVNSIIEMPELVLSDYDYSMLYGDYPDTGGEIAITDFLADTMVYHGLLEEREDAVGYNINVYGQDLLTISGIIDTDYQNKYEDVIPTLTEIDIFEMEYSEEQLKFLNDINYLYLRVFVNDTSYFEDLYSTRDEYERFYEYEENEQKCINDNYMNSYINNLRFSTKILRYNDITYTSDIPDIELSNNEVIVSRSIMNELISEDSELDEETTYQNIELPYSTELLGKSVDVVGVLDTNRSFVIVDSNYFNTLETYDTTYDVYTINVWLTDSYLANRAFLDDIHNKLYMHNTPYSEIIYNAVEIFNDLDLFFLIFGMILMALSVGLQSSLLNISLRLRQKEIGVLRALGTSRSDVRRIFLFEGFVMASAIIILSLILVQVVCNIVNNSFFTLIGYIDNYYIPVRLLYLTYEAALLVIGLSYFVTFLSILSPISKFNKMKPSDVIKGL